MGSIKPKSSELIALEQRGYILGKKIGQGSYATVHSAYFLQNECNKQSGDEKTKRGVHLACKIFDRTKAPKDFLKKFFPRELDILMQIDNPYLIQVHSILQRGPRVFIFMRYAENGDLLDYIKTHGYVPEMQAKMWFKQMASGLQYLHKLNIAHRDLKCENILLSRRFNIKLADFGFATFCVDSIGNRTISKTYCGSAAYAAPEVVQGVPYWPKMSDVWSLGIILYIMLNGLMPFDDSNLRTLLKNQMNRKWQFRPKVRHLLSMQVKCLLHEILEPIISRRLTLDQILKSNWMRGGENNGTYSSIPMARYKIAKVPQIDTTKQIYNDQLSRLAKADLTKINKFYRTVTLKPKNHA